ncbi:MAG: ATP-binding protein [Pseudobutyrivibrio sp.]|nr:ATP-binding protein [Pseudobutyrivibrio sp.]
MDINDFEYANPNAAALMQSLRAFGYDISTAIADLIDNSITAKAKNIEITFDWNNGEPWISIIDDGYGMDEEELFEAMKTGGKNPLDKREADDLGRFGLGLKTASFSQCKRLTVASKRVDEGVYIRCWDLDVVNEQNAWILLKKASDTAKEVIDNYFKDNKNGTIVFWEKIDRIIPGSRINDEEYQDAFLDYASMVKNHIAVVFSAYMYGYNKISFKLNGREIDMWDPFMSELSTKMPQEILYVNGSEVKIRPYILPHQSKLSPEEFAFYAGIHGWNAQQGFYIYRNNRLIVSGDWLVPGMEKLEQYRLARIRIDIGNETDTEWNIDVRKSTAVPPISIIKEIKRIAIASQKESSKIYRHRGKKLARKGQKEQFFVWHQNIRHGKIGYSVNREHPIIKKLLDSTLKKEIKELLDLIEETVPVPMIISDYSEKSDSMLEPYEGKNKNDFDDMILNMYEMYIGWGYTKKQAIENIANTEPFIYAPEKIGLFCEKEGIDIE